MKAWLQERPSVEVVSRDRCGLYAQAAREGAPQVRQVADRFRLVQNLQAAIKAQMNLYGQGNVRPILSEDSVASTRACFQSARLAHRKSRQELLDLLHSMRRRGLTYSEIARRTGYEHRSITKWLTSSVPQDRKRADLKPTSPLYFEKFLAECRRDGNRNGRHLFHDIKHRGYLGSRSNLERLLREWRNPVVPQPDEAPIEVPLYKPVLGPSTGHKISSNIAAALCMKPRGRLTENQVRKVDALKRDCSAFSVMRTLSMRFTRMLRSGNPR